jgi:hypothetical protein
METMEDFCVSHNNNVCTCIEGGGWWEGREEEEGEVSVCNYD